MEKHLRLQINPLIITIVGLEKVKAKYPIKDFKPIENIDQARYAAQEVGVSLLESCTAEEVCQKIVDFNNETGYIFKNRTPADILAERKIIARETGKNPNSVPSLIVIDKDGKTKKV